MTGEPIAIRGLEKKYGDVEAVAGVSLDVGASEFISILGPSGSGKTTLLMMIAGFEMPTSGRLSIGNKDITHLAPNKRNIGMVFQKYALFPHMTVTQNVGYPLKMRRVAKAAFDRKVKDALAMVQLDGLGARYPNQLSGGQQQRVAVARALVFEPQVLLMDEPLGALDKKLRENMQIEIKSLQKRLGVTVVYVTHDQEEALTMSDRIAVMCDGNIVQVGTPHDLYQNPASPFVADFIGKTNFLDVEYLGTSAADTIVQITPDRQLISSEGYSQPLRKGDRLRLAIRPEALRLSARGMGGESSIPGTVKAAVFTGAFNTFLISVDGREDQLLEAQLPASGGALPFKTDDQVDVIADRNAIRLFPAQKAHA